MILSGKMIHSVQFYNRTMVKSRTGAVTYTDTLLFSCKCSMSSNVSNWVFNNGENAWEFVTLGFRYDPRIVYGLKMTIDGIEYEIKTIKLVSYQDGFQLLARRVTPNGEV